MQRISWPEMWMKIASDLAERSYDPRLKVCAIIVPEDNTGILALGYNGNAKGLPNEVESLEPGMSGMLHAELNAVIKCPFHYPVAKHMYVTHSPCRACAKILINANITRVVYGQPYRDTTGIDLMRSVGIEVLSLADAILIGK